MEDLESGNRTDTSAEKMAHLRVPGLHPSPARNSLSGSSASFSCPSVPAFSIEGSRSVSRDRASVSHIVSNDAYPPITLDPDGIGEWAIDHHLNNLVLEVEEPKKYVLVSQIAELYRRISAIFKAPESERPEGKPAPPPKEKDKMFRISFAELQRMKLRKLQCELVKDVIHMRHQRTELSGWEERLQQYIQAVKDYEYMAAAGEQPRDPFLATGEYVVDRYVLRRMAPAGLLEEDFDKVPAIYVHEKPGEYAPICGTRGENNRLAVLKSFEKRLGMAALGGAFLVGPMWLMVLQNAQYTSLIATTVCVAAFGLIMSWFLKERKDVLASTAAYAAVLVVFVGTNNFGG